MTTIQFRLDPRAEVARGRSRSAALLHDRRRHLSQLKPPRSRGVGVRTRQVRGGEREAFLSR
eukprot:363899-Chlamydomonas_euryale.AAC.8